MFAMWYLFQNKISCYIFTIYCLESWIRKRLQNNKKMPNKNVDFCSIRGGDLVRESGMHCLYEMLKKEDEDKIG